jgi:protoporphyrinogen IX oxidase
MIAWLKVIHVSTLVIWCGGLLVLPGLYALRKKSVHDPATLRLQRFVRALFILIVSPAAFVAIGSGTALIFAREVYSFWFALKLLAVGALVGFHVLAGFRIVGVFKPGARYGALRALAAQGGTLVAVMAILWLVLAKPQIDLEVLPDWFHEPGGLQSFSERLMPIP